MLHASQIRAARGLLSWRQEDLSKAAGIATATIRRLENAQGLVVGYASTLAKIEEAFEKAGIQFIEQDEAGGIGVRLQNKTR